MSQENVETFRRGLEAYGRGDVDGLLDVLDPEVTWRAAIPPRLGGARSVYRGHEGVRELLRDIAEGLTEVQIDISDIRDLGGRIAATGRMRARGQGSGAATESPLGYVVEFRNGRIVGVRAWLDHDEALQAAGLRP